MVSKLGKASTTSPGCGRLPQNVLDIRMRLEAIDLFCGVGGLSYGFRTAGVHVRLGIDIDASCKFPLTANSPETEFLCSDVASVTGADLTSYWSRRSIRILAGCAPCQPFSPYTRKSPDSVPSEDWEMLDHFSRLIRETTPQIVSMENVPSLKSHDIYDRFLATLERRDYHISAKIVRCEDYGVPQRRRRLVLLASRLGPIKLIEPTHDEMSYVTVRQAIAHLPQVSAGAADPADPLHKARRLSPQNLERIKVARPGGTWSDWPRRLRSPCHKRKTGASFRNVYARMEWDEPAPTITTLAYNFGAGRFGHPVQNRALTLRESAILQSFPRKYRFVPPKEDVTFLKVGRLIGNAVPVKLAAAIGRSISRHVKLQGNV